jgi:hypothetical protein
VGTDAVLNTPEQYPVAALAGWSAGPGSPGGAFGVFTEPTRVTYQPTLGCSPFAAKLIAALPQAAETPRPYRTRVRTRRIRPGADVRVRLGCARGRRLVHSGSAVAFFTPRPPSPGTVKALQHRHRRSGRFTRTVVVAPPGVGDDERVELQVTALCARAP